MNDKFYPDLNTRIFIICVFADFLISFIVNIQFAFQDRESIYLVMDYLSGGDLRFHISRYRTFNEEQSSIFSKFNKK